MHQFWQMTQLFRMASSPGGPASCSTLDGYSYVLSVNVLNLQHCSQEPSFSSVDNGIFYQNPSPTPSSLVRVTFLFHSCYNLSGPCFLAQVVLSRMTLSFCSSCTRRNSHDRHQPSRGHDLCEFCLPLPVVLTPSLPQRSLNLHCDPCTGLDTGEHGQQTDVTLMLTETAVTFASLFLPNGHCLCIAKHQTEVTYVHVCVPRTLGQHGPYRA